MKSNFRNILLTKFLAISLILIPSYAWAETFKLGNKEFSIDENLKEEERATIRESLEDLFKDLPKAFDQKVYVFIKVEDLGDSYIALVGCGDPKDNEAYLSLDTTFLTEKRNLQKSTLYHELTHINRPDFQKKGRTKCEHILGEIAAYSAELEYGVLDGIRREFILDVLITLEFDRKFRKCENP